MQGYTLGRGGGGGGREDSSEAGDGAVGSKERQGLPGQEKGMDEPGHGGLGDGAGQCLVVVGEWSVMRRLPEEAGDREHRGKGETC